MQPYFSPYLGYFQMVNAVDLFVFYDHVNFIKGGWINRNKITSSGKEFLFTIPLVDASSFRPISETRINWSSKEIGKLVNNIGLSYKKAANYGNVMPIVERLFAERPDTIAQLAINSVVYFSEYLAIPTQFKTSSKEHYPIGDDRSLNLKAICNAEQSGHYINPIGGQELYTKEHFADMGIRLNFIKGTPSLSIIDVCMQHSVSDIQNMLTDYQLI